jgi:hypothetical protein
MNAQTWQGIAARAGVVGEGAYHAAEVAGWHELARIAALVLLLLLLCHGVERRLLERMEARAKSDH